MKIRKLYKNTDIQNQPPNTSPNIVNFNKDKDTLLDIVEDGFDLFTTLETTVYPLGQCVLNDKEHVLFTKKDTNVNFPAIDEIGVVDNGVYRTVLRSNTLGFSIEKQIEARFYINNIGERIVYFVDNFNVPRFINIDNTAYLNLDANFDFIDITDIDLLSIFPQSELANINLVAVNNTGGTLKPGAYYVTYKYLDENLNETNFLNVSNPIYIIENSSSEGANSYDNYLPNINDTTTTKSITLEFDGLDPKYPYIKLGIIKYNSGTFVVDEIGPIAISSNLSYTYTGNEDVTVGSIQDILVDRVSYASAKGISILDNRLYLSGLTNRKDVGFQKYANLIEVDYTSKYIPVSIVRGGGAIFSGSHKDEVTLYSEKCFQHDEVYALYIALIFKDGTYSKAYTIPGRASLTIDTSSKHSVIASVADETALVSSLTTIPGQEEYLQPIIDNIPNAKFYQVYNTANNSAANVNMGFWENEDEQYPNTDDFDSSAIGGLDLRTVNVRHHRFPNLSDPDVNTLTGVGTATSNEYVRPTQKTVRILGLKFKNLSNVFTQDIIDQIQGYQIYYATRNENNRIVLAHTSPIHHRLTTSGGKQLILPNTFNTRDIANSEIIGFKSFDTINNNSLNRASILKSEWLSEGIAGAVNVQDTTYAHFTALTSLTRGTPTQYIRTIDDVIKVPSNSATTTADLSLNASYNIRSIESQKIDLLFLDSGYSALTPSVFHASNMYYYNTVAEQYLTNMYNSFDNRLLISTGRIIKDFVNDFEIYGGDTVATTFGWRESVVRIIAGIPVDYSTVHFTVVESYSGLQYRGAGEPTELTYPISDGTTINTQDLSIEEKYFNIVDYSLLNDKDAAIPKSKNTFDVSDFANRIIRSAVADNESQIDKLRIFLPNDYIDLPRNRGSINHIKEFNNFLMINMTKAATRTIGKQTVNTDSLIAYLGNGDIFQLDPQEVVYTDIGYAGSQSQWCTPVAEYGYLFADQIRGRVFLLSNQIKEISDPDMQQFFFENLPSKLVAQLRDIGVTFANQDNPANPYGIGLTGAYDNKYKRYIISKKDYSIKDMSKVHIYEEGEIPPLGDLVIKDGKIYQVRLVDVPPTTEYFIIASAGGDSNFIGNIIDFDTDYFNNESFTISYYPKDQTWGSFYTYKPKFMYFDDNGVYSSIDNRLFRHNSELTKCVFYNGVHEQSIFDVVFNEKSNIRKTFSSFGHLTRSYNGSFENQLDTFNRIIVFDSYQISGEVEITNTITSRKTQDVFSINEFRDLTNDYTLPVSDNGEPDLTNVNVNKPWFDKKKFQDGYCVVRYIYDNTNDYKLVVFEFYSNLRLMSR